MIELPNPHFEKLAATLENVKLPLTDIPRIEDAIKHYEQWIADLGAIQETSVKKTIEKMVALLNQYRNYLDIEVIFDSSENFLYRQKGQIKLDNSVTEEFLPILIKKCVLDGIDDLSLELGPKKAFSAVYFASSLDEPQTGGGLNIRTKDQDFTISRRVFLQTSYTPNFSSAETKNFALAYVAAECKTNLDKTMFQEACTTANDVKSSVQGAKYFLLCEWLDMTPQNTASTAIDEVLILRRSKRMPSSARAAYATADGRQKNRQAYVDFLRAAPFSPELFERFVAHVSNVVAVSNPAENDVLKKGYF